ncbi:thiamine diphosphate-binding protein [Fusarium oxysporum Fo47]|uniref:Pyruvate decarboxylase n=2 Tax=Fusarium oxysporum TaxID=5507 RepID=A0A3L6NXC0_FUSOX|nr:thiamine diphosphate-binding protein [Fusarium oxysporum Fo47]RKK23011.1 Pyruvate decarboxylase [Fusarium oxysporum f. sp. cepae]EWZ46047.1 pyruvate decarboxylase [Fusarium oxysporum Fo47]QKD52073.1 Thiamin diphosphate-binding protein [Fusarium oxysporum Fo47]RKK27279.1 Pyruvate decarboxylase [Fusarium oxysporum f. sp. cepae]RKK31455.1 Pyruvate decarboxylase [Fusarium oxysporum f. sp. cepae]
MKTSSVNVAEYLFRRLRQLDVTSIHGVPGDFNLTLLDYIAPAGLTWVGNANELNAGYAADGYARVKGIGSLVTTFGVGELSAVNAIAGAYAERAAVVHIVGIPSRATQESRLLVHHTFGDGEYGRFAEIHRHVTVAQTRLLDVRTIPDQIDSVLQQCLLHSRPVYIEVPVDLVDAPVSAAGLSHTLTLPTDQANASTSVAVSKILHKIYTAKQPLIVVDGEVRPMRVVNEVQEIVRATGWPTWVTGYSKSLVDEGLANFHGVNKGSFEASTSRDFIKQADLILCFGPHFTSTNTFLFSSIPDPQVTILFMDTEVRLGNETIRNCPVKPLLARLLQDLDLTKIHKYDPYPDLHRDSLLSFSGLPSDGVIDQKNVWRLLGNFLRPGDILMAETGTAAYGARHIHLPSHSKYFGPVTWLSIGYMLPAAQGAALAQKELMGTNQWSGIDNARTVLLMGDGSFQMTAQELSTMIRHDLNVVVFLINNDGYTIERCIHGLTQGYNDVPSWRYLEAPRFFGAPKDTFTRSAKNWGELEDALGSKALHDGKGLRMVEVLMGREDAPEGPLTQYLDKQQMRVNGKI